MNLLEMFKTLTDEEKKEFAKLVFNELEEARLSQAQELKGEIDTLCDIHNALRNRLQEPLAS